MTEKIIQAIEDKRLLLGLSKAELARQAGITLQSLINFYNLKPPTIKTVEKLLNVLNIEFKII